MTVLSMFGFVQEGLILHLWCFRAELDKLRGVIDGAKHLKIAAARPSILAAEENLHSMVVDLDSVVTRVNWPCFTLLTHGLHSNLFHMLKKKYKRNMKVLFPFFFNRSNQRSPKCSITTKSLFLIFCVQISLHPC